MVSGRSRFAADLLGNVGWACSSASRICLIKSWEAESLCGVVEVDCSTVGDHCSGWCACSAKAFTWVAFDSVTSRRMPGVKVSPAKWRIVTGSLKAVVDQCTQQKSSALKEKKAEEI